MKTKVNGVYRLFSSKLLIKRMVTDIKDQVDRVKFNIKKAAIAIFIVLPLVILIHTIVARLSHSGDMGGSHIRFQKQQRVEPVIQSKEAIIVSEFIYEEAPF